MTAGTCKHVDVGVCSIIIAALSFKHLSCDIWDNFREISLVSAYPTVKRAALIYERNRTDK